MKRLLLAAALAVGLHGAASAAVGTRRSTRFIVRLLRASGGSPAVGLAERRCG